MKFILSYTGVFLLGLVLGYFVNIFVTNRSYYDILSENRELKFQIENLKAESADLSEDETAMASHDESLDLSSTDEIQKEYLAPDPTSPKAAPASVRRGSRQ